MAINNFELQGRVGWIETQYNETKDKSKVFVMTKINLGVKKREGAADNDAKNWNNFFITFFNRNSSDDKGKTAENLANTVKKGDYIRCIGTIEENRYKPEGAEEEKSEIQLVGWGFRKQMYDDMKMKWVDV